MKKLLMVLAISLVVFSVMLSGCQTANKVPGVTAIKSAVATIVPPATALTTINPLPTATPFATATVR